MNTSSTQSLISLLCPIIKKHGIFGEIDDSRAGIGKVEVKPGTYFVPKSKED